MLFREIFAIYCENRRKHVNTHSLGEMQSYAGDTVL
jgi:hypothetical protein